MLIFFYFFSKVIWTRLSHFFPYQGVRIFERRLVLAETKQIHLFAIGKKILGPCKKTCC